MTSGETNNAATATVEAPVKHGAAGPDIETALNAFTSASRRVEEYYRRLEGEVLRLTDDLERKNGELSRKIVEHERMQAMLFSTLQNLPCGVLTVGDDGIVVAANPAACEIFERPVQEIAGKLIDVILPDIPRRSRLVDALFEIEAPTRAQAEWVVETNGHCRRTVKLSAIRAGSHFHRHLAGLILAEDVTELRRLEQAEALQSRLSGIGELAMNLAHEIRNPLGSISLYATSLAHELGGDASLCPMAESLVAGVHALEHVVTNVLEFARPRRLSMTRVNLVQVLKDALAFIEHPRSQKGVETEFHAIAPRGEAAEAWIAGDGEQLRQVFLNIMLNALQAMDDGGRLRVSLRAIEGERWEVEIADNGVGIAPRDVERIFDPFYSTKDKGSGIGLAVVHRIVTAHRARIDVDTQVGRGACFRLTFKSDPFFDEESAQ